MKKIYLMLIFIYCNSTILFAQNINKREAEKIKEEVKDLVRSLPEYLNIIGSNENTTKDIQRTKQNMLSLFVKPNVLMQRDFQLSSNDKIANDNFEAIEKYIENIDIQFSHWETRYENLEVSEISRNTENNSLFVCVIFDRILKGNYNNGTEIVSSDKRRKLDAFVEISTENGKRQLKISGISFHNPNRRFNPIEITESEKPIETITITSPTYTTNAEKGTNLTISWQSNTKGTIRIDLLKNGVEEVVITYNTSNSGEYNWTLPNYLLSGTYQIRLVTEGGFKTISDGFLIKDKYIAPKLTKSLLPALVCIPLPSFSNKGNLHEKLSLGEKDRAGWWLETVLVYGLVGGSIYLNSQSQDYYKQYNAALEPEQRAILFDRADLYNKISITSQWTGLAYWGATIVATYIKTPKTKKIGFAPMLQKPKPFWAARMQPSGFSLVYSF